MEKAYDEIKVRDSGASLIISIPKRIVNFLELNSNDPVLIDAETGKKGKYMTLWKKEK